MAKNYSVSPIKVPRFEEALGFYTSKERSKMMSNIKSKNTKAEILFRKALWRTGVRYRINHKKLPGSPDVSSITLRFAVFIDGEFWHGYNWEEKKNKIKSNRKFWIPKIERNIQRDRENDYKLLEMGFVVFRFWEKQVHKELNQCIRQVLDYIEVTKNEV